MREGDTVNVFDRAVAAVAPVHAAKRAAARAALKIIDSGYGNYGANLTKKSLRGWEFYGGSAKEDIEDNIDILRQRSRDAYMGIPTASAALKTMRTNVIAGGLMPAPQIDAEFLGLTPEDAEKLQAQIVREFALWADTPVCDADRVDNFYKLQQLTFLSYAMNKKVKKNKSASRAPAGESIEQRPEEIDEREEFGHWEGDTVYSGKGKRKTTRALLTLTERKTRKEIIIAIPNRKAETVVKALDALERKLGARRFRAIFKSITFDNGTEFAAAEELERSCVNKRLPRTKVYFCHPYSSWERGTNENTNGMIRRRFPKGTNFAAVTNAQIAQAENWINNYPRKILGYKSSEIVFRECLRELGIAA